MRVLLFENQTVDWSVMISSPFLLIYYRFRLSPNSGCLSSLPEPFPRSRPLLNKLIDDMIHKLWLTIVWGFNSFHRIINSLHFGLIQSKKSEKFYILFFCENRNILCVEKYRLIVIDVIPSMEYAHSTDMARQTLNDEQIEQYWKNAEKISNL